MNLELFIAKRLIFDKENKKNVSYIIAKIATFSIALSLIVMIIAVAIVTGFKKEIRNKVVGFGAHIQIVNYDSNNSFETPSPVNKNQNFYPSITHNSGIRHIQTFATKPGIIKTETDIQGVVLKGIDTDFDWSFFKNNLVEGDLFEVADSLKTNKTLISKFIASLLKFNVNDEFILHFPQQEPARYLRLQISGIYETGLEEFDKMILLADIKHIQRLNSWTKDQVSGFEILIDDFKDLEQMSGLVFEEAGLLFMEDGAKLRIQNIKDKYPQIFDWINLQNMNVAVLLIIIIIVAGLNMATGLLILILERTNMIGVLKSFGTENSKIKNVFLYQAGYLIFKGLVWGNMIGLGFCAIQYYFKPLKLDQSSYWLSAVPINVNIVHVLIMNMGTILIILLVLLIPSVLISKINPVKTIRYN